MENKENSLYVSRVNAIRKENPFTSYVDIVYEVLLESIIRQDLEPNQKLKESTLADEFGMSRSPVRDALKMLEDNGFITKTETGGYIVTPFNIVDYADFLEMRLTIEPVAAYYAARYINAEGRKTLKKNIDNYYEAAKNHDFLSMINIDHAFHKEIVKQSKNRYFQEIYKTYEKTCMYYRSMVSSVDISTENSHYNLTKHKQIYDLIVDHNEDGARKAMEDHLKFYMKNALRRMKVQ